jgi:2-iminobutanoate/2-iminopropanoate deaminase
MSREIISTEKAPAAVGPYVQASVVNGIIYCSGQLGLIPETGLFPEGVEAQAKQALDNAGAILNAAGSGYDKVFKTTIYLADMNDFAAVNAIYASYFSGSFPARSCVEVSALPKGALVEIEVIAAI